MSNQVSLDSQEMKDFLTHIIENNRYIQNKGMKPVATEVIGDSGLGKTTVALDIAEANGLNFVKLNLAQIEELGDLVGFPVRQFELCKKSTVSVPTSKPQYVMKRVVVDGKPVMKKVLVEGKGAPTEAPLTDCIWIDENAVDQYTKQGFEFTGNKRMSYCPPEWISGKEGGGILILDDWNRADMRFIQACMEICDRQEYISWKLPKDWHIILTANPDNGEYLVNSIDTAQSTRFVSVVMKWNHERWAEWAEQQNLDGRCINFVLMHPEIVNAKVNPRAITTFFNCISSFENFNQRLPMIQMIGEGSVGTEVATLFTTFIHNKMDKLITPKEILTGADDVKVSSDLLNAIQDDDGKYRADIASLLTTRLINFALLYASKNTIEDKHINRLIHLVKDPDVFTDDLKYHLVKKILNGNKQKFAKLMFNDVVQDYVTK